MCLSVDAGDGPRGGFGCSVARLTLGEAGAEGSEEPDHHLDVPGHLLIRLLRFSV